MNRRAVGFLLLAGQFRSALAVPLRALACVAFLYLAAGCSENDTSACSAGSAGCECVSGDLCGTSNGLPLFCNDNTCVSADQCPTATEGCPCRDDGACAAGLTCSDVGSSAAICHDEPPCPPGSLGCGCYADDSCNSGLACDGTTCFADDCVAGEQGCRCAPGRSCEDGVVCANDLCVEDTGQTLVAPSDPQCYTPCKGDLVQADGTRIACSIEGLLPACVGNTTCVQGSCVVPQSQSATGFALAEGDTCITDAHCPDFQSCIEGQCYSDCVSNSDCRAGRECHRAACRIPCTTTSDACPEGDTCEAVDNDPDQGFCQTLGTTSVDGIAPLTPPSYEVAPRGLSFSVQDTSGAFVIQNTSDRSVSYQVSKLEHTVLTGAGSETETAFPMPWLTLGTSDENGNVIEDPAVLDTLTIVLAPDEQVTIEVGEGHNPSAAASDPAFSRWEGKLRVQADSGSSTDVKMTYVRSLEGQWVGSAIFLADFGVAGLQEWRDGGRTDASNVANALVRRWQAFKDGSLSLFEFNAALSAVREGDWNTPRVRERCPSIGAPDPDVGCYLAPNPAGISVFSDSLRAAPIPSGVAELPFAMNIKADPSNPTQLSGRIVSDFALQYGNDPTVELTLDSDAAGCTESTQPGAATCRTLISDFTSTIQLGGRWNADPADVNCAAAPAGTFVHTAIPWLIPGFVAGTVVNATTGLRERFECRDGIVPLGASQEDLNVSLAQANPLPDGSSRLRTLRLLDGAVVNQNTIVLLFEENFDSFLDPADTDGFSAFGFMMLSRSSIQPPADEFIGSSVPAAEPIASQLAIGCDEELLDTMDTSVGADNSRMAATLIAGVDSGASVVPIGGDEFAYYLCHDTDQINEPCPETSARSYFTVSRLDASFVLSCNEVAGQCRDGEPCSSPAAIAPCSTQPGVSCPAKGSCEGFLDYLRRITSAVRDDVKWQCDGSTEFGAFQGACDEDPSDLLAGKLFLAESSPGAMFAPIDEVTREAFRYKTKFVTRDGIPIGFAPDLCVPGSNSIPYCYDAGTIEQAAQRIDCATHLYTEQYDTLDDPAKALLKDFLQQTFSFTEIVDPLLPTPIIIDGFEKLRAELLVMQGDESLTQAFASRFDVAGIRAASFPGATLEPGGINLSGGAGFEMFSLYQAVQYYQLALDRFFSQGPSIWLSLDPSQGPPVGEGFITQGTVVSYFARLVRASTKKAEASSAIAARYQSFNRPDLARLVIRRSYSAAYMESITLSRMMSKIVEVSSDEDRDQILRELDLGQKRYTKALREMSKVFSEISDEETFFGIPNNSVSFPPLDPGDVNAFEKRLEVALDKLALASDSEDRALDQSRDFDTDAALFQSTLSDIESGFRGSIGEICGTFVGDDGSVYPAISEFKGENERATGFSNPCGMMGTGALLQETIALANQRTDVDIIRAQIASLSDNLRIIRSRVTTQCSNIQGFADFVYVQGQARLEAEARVRALEISSTKLDDALELATQVKDDVACIPPTLGVAVSAGNCISKAIGISIWSTVAAAIFAGAITLDVSASATQDDIGNIELTVEQRSLLEECDALEIDGIFDVQELLNELPEIELSLAQAQRSIVGQAGVIEALWNEALSLEAGRKDAKTLAVDIEAARNDPNVRIFRNGAVIDADKKFTAALKEAFRLTRLFEYFTSQSYGPKQDLVLIRLANNGENTLDQYLRDLVDEFDAFENQFGNPDVRLEVLSLRDDIFRIPRTDTDGVALSSDARLALFRDKLNDPAMRDARGYITMPFSTNLDDLSPITRNHKIRYMEAEIIEQEPSDSLGRVYVRQRGTSIIRSVDDNLKFDILQPRTAVINTFFSGKKTANLQIYRNERLRDFPLVNTAWDLVLNLKDEHVNEDIRSDGLNDIVLYLYYTDFTAI